MDQKWAKMGILGTFFQKVVGTLGFLEQNWSRNICKHKVNTISLRRRVLRPTNRIVCAVCQPKNHKFNLLNNTHYCSYRHVNVQIKPLVKLLCSDIIGPYHKIYNVYIWLTKCELSQVGVGSNIAHIHSFGIWEVIICISGHYWPQFTWRFDNMWN